MNETALITVSALPEIQENLRLLKERWEQKAADAAAMVCTEETVQTIKQMRADMRKEYEEADRQRKAAKAMYLAPWNAVEETFRECVSNAATQADKSFKATIDEFEGELKAACLDNLARYFAEMCKVYGVDYLSFDKAMEIGKIRVSLSDAKKKTPRQLQDAITAVIDKVAVGEEQIRKLPDAGDIPEIMSEYKNCFDVGSAISTVKERKRKIEAEIAAAKARVAAQEAQEAAIQKVAAVATAPTEEKAQKTAFSRETEKEPIFDEFTFTVFGCTKTQLIRIREFLKQEGIQYE